MKKVLIPYFLAGSGHLVSAIAIQHYLRKKRPSWEVRLFEPSEELGLEPLDGLYKRSWNAILKKPILSAIIFFLAENIFSFIPYAVNRRVTRAATPAMTEFLNEYKPDFIITTHWGCGHVVAEAMKAGAPVCPLFVTRNDLGGAYRLQRVDCDRIIVMSPEAEHAFRKLRVPAERILQVNPVVRPEFLADNAGGTVEPDSLSGEKQNGLKILLTSGGEGIGNIKKTSAMILETADRIARAVAIDILTGRNEQLRCELTRDLDDPRITVHGYRDDVHTLMKAADIVVGKCGANSTMETVMSGKPFLITQIGAPNEHGNKQYILKRGYGWYARSFKSLERIIIKVMQNENEMAKKMKNLTKRPVVNGAAQIADTVIETMEKKTASSSLQR